MFNIFIKLASSTVIAFIVRDRESQRAREPKMVNEKLNAQKVNFEKKKCRKNDKLPPAARGARFRF